MAVNDRAGVSGGLCTFAVAESIEGDGGGTWWDPKGTVIARPPPRPSK